MFNNLLKMSDTTKWYVWIFLITYLLTLNYFGFIKKLLNYLLNSTLVKFLIL